MNTGRISRLETFGAVDGPGVRFVVFFQGCPLRCAYCHNPETWELEGGKTYGVSEIMKQVQKYRSYYREGGLTASGGEPLMQADFLTELFAACRREGVHTALDTAGSVWNSDVERAIGSTDLVLLDIKFTNEPDYEKYTGGSYQTTLEFLKRLEEREVPVWLRQVIVPGLHDNSENLRRLTELRQRYHNIEAIELLPFRKLCLHKYEELEIPFPMEQFPECSQAILEACNAEIIS